MEAVLTWPQIGTIIVLIGSIVGIYRWVSSEIAREQNERLKLERDLSAYKIFVSQTLVSASSLAATEERLVIAVEKLASRMEIVVSRLDKLAIDMAAGKHYGA